MLTMSDTQVDGLADYKLALFERRCLAYLEEHFPERAAFSDAADPADHEQALAEVHAGVESASLRGCITEAEVVKYLYLRALLGSEFDLDPASSPVAALMNDERLPIDERLERSFELAAQAAGDGDELTPDAPAIGARAFFVTGLRATKPIDPTARDAANDAFYQAHPEMVKNGQRVKIKPEAGKQASLRQQWLRLYAKNGGGVEKVKAKHITNALNGANDNFSSAPVGGSCQTCALPKRTTGKGGSSGASTTPSPPPPSNLRSTGSSKPSQGTPLNCVFKKATLTCEHGRKASPQGVLMVVPTNSSASGDLVDCAMTFSGGCGQHPAWAITGPSPADVPGLGTSVLAKTWTFSALGLVALQAVSPQVYRAEAGGCSGRGRNFEIRTYPPGKVGGKLDLSKLQDWVYGKLGYVVAEDELNKWTPHWFRGSAEYGGGWQEDKASWKACFEHAVTIGFDPLYDMAFKYPVYPEGLVPQAIASWLPGGVVIEAKAGAKLQYAFKAAYWPSEGKTVVSEHAAVGGGAGSLALQLELKSASLEVVEAAASGESGFSLELAAVKGDDAAIKLEFKFGGLKAKASLKLAWGWVELSREFQVISEWAPEPWEWKLT